MVRATIPRGNAENPVSTEELEQKFIALVGSRFGNDTAALGTGGAAFDGALRRHGDAVQRSGPAEAGPAFDRDHRFRAAAIGRAATLRSRIPNPEHGRHQPQSTRVPGIPPGRPRAVRPVRQQVLAGRRRARRLSRGVRQGADRRRLARRADSRAVRRRRPERHRSVGHSRGDQSLGRQLRRVPRADVHHGHAAAARLGGSRSSSICRRIAVGRAAAAVVRRDRADDRHRHHEDAHLRHPQGRPLHRQRPEGVDLADPAFGSDAAARAHDAAAGGEEEDRRPVDLPGRSCAAPSRRG